MRRLLSSFFPIDSMSKYFKTTFIVIAFALGTTVVAAAQQDQIELYNNLNYRGNIAAQNGDFEAAIVYWKKAIPIDPDPVKKCRGESLRTSIKAAQNTISMLRQGKLLPSAAPQWFNNDSNELWLPNPCNSN